MKTLIILKPDAVQQHIVGEILTRFEDKGYQFDEIKYFKPSRELIETHYQHLKIDKPNVFKDCCDFMTSGKVLAVKLEMPDTDSQTVIDNVRALVGDTDPAKAAKGTIRADYGTSIGRNIIHASDSLQSYLDESYLWFGSN